MSVRRHAGTYVEVSNLSKRYRRADNFALDGVSFKASKGTILGILGVNGSGKTTLARLIIGLLRPTHGTVLLNDKVMTGKERLTTNIGYVPQFVPAFPGLTGRDLIEFVLVTHGVYGSRKRRAREEIVARLELEKIESKLLWNMSQGQARLTLTAAALASKPRLLVFDEPSNGLDPGRRRELWLLLQEVKRTWSPTILLITHDVADAEQVIDEALVLRAGKLAMSGNASQLRRNLAPHAVIKVVTEHDMNSSCWRKVGANRWERVVPQETAEEMLIETYRSLGETATEITIGYATLEDVLLSEART